MTTDNTDKDTPDEEKQIPFMPSPLTPSILSIPCIHCEAEGLESLDPSLKICISCHEHFCSKHASKQSILHCINCFHDITVENKEIQKKSVKFSVKKQEFVTRIQSCRQITFEGETWRSYTKLIHTLTDEELRDTLELTRGAVYMMESEILARNIDAARKQALKDTEYKVKVKTISSTKTQKIKLPIQKDISDSDSKAMLLSSLKKAGITKEQLQLMLEKLQTKKDMIQ